MNTVAAARYSVERRAYGRMFSVAAASLLFFGLLCALQQGRLRATLKRMHEAAAEIRTGGPASGELSLERVLAKEQARQERLGREWETLRLKTDTFKWGSPLAEALSSDEEGRIDFKVALFKARSRLQQTAASNDIAFPEDLGMQGTIGTDEHAETRLWQLASVVKLVEACFQLGVPSILSLNALPPVEYPLLEEEAAIALEFPVRMRIHGSYATLVEILGATADDRSFFSLREFRVEKTEQGPGSLLTVDMVCGGILFQLRGEDDAVIPADGEVEDA